MKLKTILEKIDTDNKKVSKTKGNQSGTEEERNIFFTKLLGSKFKNSHDGKYLSFEQEKGQVGVTIKTAISKLKDNGFKQTNHEPGANGDGSVISNKNLYIDGHGNVCVYHSSYGTTAYNNRFSILVFFSIDAYKKEYRIKD